MKKTGFSLVELLVAIGIIAVLSAILLPVFAHVRDKARQTECLSNIKEVILAIKMYSDDNNGAMVPTNNESIKGGGFLPVILNPYVKNKDIFYCPNGPYKNVSNPDVYPVLLNYGINNRICPWIQKDGTIPALSPGCGAMGAIPNPAETILYLDSGWMELSGSYVVNAGDKHFQFLPGSANCTGLQGPSDGSNIIGNTEWGFSESQITNLTSLAKIDFKKGRHTGGINVGYCDGHAAFSMAQPIVDASTAELKSYTEGKKNIFTPWFMACY